MDDRDIAGEIFRVLGAGAQIGPPTRRDPTFSVERSYRVARLVREARENSGDKVVGRKIGFTNRAGWAKFQASAPMWSYMYASTVRDLAPQGSRAPLAGQPEPCIEPEIVFGLSAAPTPDMDQGALMRCVGWVAHGFEIVQSLYPGRDCLAADAIAAYGMHAACWIGPRHAFAPRADAWRHELATCEVDLFRDGAHADHGFGANVLDSPLNALRAVVAVLAADRHNPPLAAGEIVTTGTLTRALPIAAGETWTTKLSGVALDGIGLTFD